MFECARTLTIRCFRGFCDSDSLKLERPQTTKHIPGELKTPSGENIDFGIFFFDI